MRFAVRSTLVPICLAIVALAPALASARPFEPIPTVHVDASTGIATPLGQSPRVQPNPDQQAVVARHRTVVSPILKPVTASQMAASELAKAHAAIDNRPTGGYRLAALNGHGSVHPVSTPASPSAHPDNGFDWGDAAIGAAACLVLTMLVVGGGVVLSHRRAAPSDRPDVATT